MPNFRHRLPHSQQKVYDRSNSIPAIPLRVSPRLGRATELLVQHLTAFFHVGEHNIIRLEGADWNDGMDMAALPGYGVVRP